MKGKIKYPLTLICMGLALIILIIYFFWLFGNGVGNIGIQGFFLSFLAVTFFCIGLARTGQTFKRTPPLTIPGGKPPYIALGLWILAINAVLITWALMSSPGAKLTEALENVFYTVIDAENYVKIAENWYFPVDGPEFQYKIAFFPLYSVLLAAVNFVIRNMPIAGMLISSVCAYIGGLAVFRIAQKEIGKGFAKAALRFMYLLPPAFFLMVPMTESLYLMLTAMFFLKISERKHITAAVMAFLAALTRPQGFLLVIPFVIELILEAKEKGFIKTLKYAPLVLAAPVGIGCYFLINLQIYGDPLYFLQIQSEHWSNSLSVFWNTPVYLLSYMKSYIAQGEWRLVIGLSIPNLIAFFGGLFLIVSGAKSLRPSITIYALAYFAMSFGITWLLSGPRYLCCLFPIALSAGRVRTKGRGPDFVLSFAFFVFFVVYVYLYFNRYNVF